MVEAKKRIARMNELRVPGCIERVPSVCMAENAHYTTPSFWRRGIATRALKDSQNARRATPVLRVKRPRKRGAASH